MEEWIQLKGFWEFCERLLIIETNSQTLGKNWKLEFKG